MISIIGAAVGAMAAHLGRSLASMPIPAAVRPSVARRLVPRYLPSFNATKRLRKAYRACRPGALGTVKLYRRKRATKRGGKRAKEGGGTFTLLCIAGALAYGFYLRFG